MVRAASAAFGVMLIGLPAAFGAGGDRGLGQYLSAECVTCHQLSGSVTGAVPGIVGLPEDQFIAVMNSYKAKERDNEVMQTIAGRLGAEDIAALAAYFGSLPSVTK